AQDLFDEASAEVFATRLNLLLTMVAADPDLRMEALDLMSAAERQTILHDWNDTWRRTPDATLETLFEQQAANTPAAVAIVSDEESLTYRDVDVRSNQLARYLQSIGVEPGAMIGVFLERCVDYPISV